MHRDGLVLVIFVLLILVFGTGSASSAQIGGVAVTDIRFAQDAGRIRIVLDSAASLPFTWEVATDGRHMSLTLVGIDWRLPKSQTVHTARSLVGYQFEPAIGGAGQVSIEAVSPIHVLSVREIPAGPEVDVQRIVIDLTTEPSGLSLDDTSIALKQGVRAVLGLDGSPDFALAVQVFTKAAEAGNAQAAFNLGEMYRTGLGLPQNYQRAAGWFERAARADFAPARFYLAVLVFNGLGVPRDQERARDLLKLAAQQGFLQARQALADLR